MKARQVSTAARRLSAARPSPIASPPRQAERRLRAPYHVRKAAPKRRMAGSSPGSAWVSAPNPAMPATISTASEIAQIRQTGSTCARISPCRSTKAFCAPIATISESPRANPASAACMSLSFGPCGLVACGVRVRLVKDIQFC